MDFQIQVAWKFLCFTFWSLQAVAFQSWDGKKIGSRSSHIRHLLLFLKLQISVCFPYQYSSCSLLTPSALCMIYIMIHVWLNLGMHTSGTIWHFDSLFHICIKVRLSMLQTNIFSFFTIPVNQWNDFLPPSLVLAYLTNISRFHSHFVSKSYQSIRGGKIRIIGATEYLCFKRQYNIIEYCGNIKPHINHAANVSKGQFIFWFWFPWMWHWQ